jgi:putative hydrolase of the HAD superfamily
MKVALFDLGGVLVRFEGVSAVAALSEGRLDPEEARRFWITSAAVARFETGAIDADTFARQAVAELGFDLEPARFLELFATWDQGPLPGARELLAALRGHVRLACLTNNNEIHWRHLRDRFGLAREFERCYVSYEMRLRKPEAAVFAHVLRDLGERPEEILFLDDNPECVEAGSAAGLTSRLVRGTDEARAECAALLSS